MRLGSVRRVCLEIRRLSGICHRLPGWRIMQVSVDAKALYITVPTYLDYKEDLYERRAIHIWTQLHARPSLTQKPNPPPTAGEAKLSDKSKLYNKLLQGPQNRFSSFHLSDFRLTHVSSCWAGIPSYIPRHETHRRGLPRQSGGAGAFPDPGTECHPTRPPHSRTGTVSG